MCQDESWAAAAERLPVVRIGGVAPYLGNFLLWGGVAGTMLVLLALIAVQIALGIATLLLVVPLPLAAAHQAGAVLVFALRARGALPEHLRRRLVRVTEYSGSRMNPASTAPTTAPKVLNP